MRRRLVDCRSEFVSIAPDNFPAAVAAGEFVGQSLWLRDGLSHRMIRLKPDRRRERPPHNSLRSTDGLDGRYDHVISATGH